jgi:hypothetical protein
MKLNKPKIRQILKTIRFLTADRDEPVEAVEEWVVEKEWEAAEEWDVKDKTVSEAVSRKDKIRGVCVEKAPLTIPN